MKKLLDKIIITLCVTTLLFGLTGCGRAANEVSGVGFEELGLVCNVEEGVEYDYLSCLTDDTSKNVMMKAMFTDYKTYPHPEKENYELREVSLTLTLENLNENAAAQTRVNAYVDYYTLSSENKRPEGDIDLASGTETVDVNGTAYDISYKCQLANRRFSDDGNTGYMDFTFEYEVPTGYDGVVIALYNHANSKKGASLVDNYDKDTLFFRLVNKEKGNSVDVNTLTEITPKGEMLTVEDEYITYKVFAHADKYINPNISLAEAFFYIPEGMAVTLEELPTVLDIEKYYDESHEYTYSDPAKMFTAYMLAGMVDLEHSSETYMWNTLVECFNTMSYNDICTYIEEHNYETSEVIVKTYACEYIKFHVEGLVWN